MVDTIWSPSPNHSPGPRSVRGIVLHDTEGSLQGSLRRLTEPGGPSAHYVIAFDGTTYQLVSEDDVAYHVAAFGANPALNRNRPAWLGAYNGLYSAVNAVTVGIELVGYASQGYTSDQYQVLGELIREICARWGIVPACLPDAGADATIITHGWLQTDRSDPGPLFDWDALKAAMGEQDEMAISLTDDQRAALATLDSLGWGNQSILDAVSKIGRAAEIGRLLLAIRRLPPPARPLADELSRLG